MDSGSLAHPFSVSSVCEGRRLMGLEENKGLKYKIQFFIPIMEFISSWTHSFISTLLDFSKNSVLEENWLKNQTSSFFKRFIGFVNIIEWIPIKIGKIPKYMRFYL